MNEYLFRGKRVDNDEWVYGGLLVHDEGERTTYYIVEPLDERNSIYDAGTHAIQVRPDTVCQWTGSYDKDGVRIFVGDVVEYDLISPYAGPEYYIHEKGPVIFSDNAFMPLVYCVPDTILVVGNIHEKR